MNDLMTLCFLVFVLPLALVGVLARQAAEKRKEAEAKLQAARQEAANKGQMILPPSPPAPNPLLGLAAKVAGEALGTAIKGQFPGGGNGRAGSR